MLDIELKISIFLKETSYYTIRLSKNRFFNGKSIHD